MSFDTRSAAGAAMILRWGLLIAVYGALIILGWVISDQVSARLVETAGGNGLADMMWPIALICGVYLLASAIPFVPGAEIGLGLIAVFGARVALLVYLCMICALSLSFLVGRLVPGHWLVEVFTYMRLYRAADLVRDMSSQPPEAIEARLGGMTDNRFLLALLGYRYVALALAINLPGNTVLGGGGGLALLAGMSRLFSPLGFFMTLLVAVAPIPLTVFMMGYQP